MWRAYAPTNRRVRVSVLPPFNGRSARCAAVSGARGPPSVRRGAHRAIRSRAVVAVAHPPDGRLRGRARDMSSEPADSGLCDRSITLRKHRKNAFNKTGEFRGLLPRSGRLRPVVGPVASAFVVRPVEHPNDPYSHLLSFRSGNVTRIAPASVAYNAVDRTRYSHRDRSRSARNSERPVLVSLVPTVSIHPMFMIYKLYIFNFIGHTLAICFDFDRLIVLLFVEWNAKQISFQFHVRPCQILGLHERIRPYSGRKIPKKTN